MHLLHELRVTTNLYCTNYVLLFAYDLRVTFYSMSYELFLFHELQVTFITRVVTYCSLHELRVTFCIWVTSQCLTTSYSKDKVDEAVDDSKVMIKNYTLGSYFDAEFGWSLSLAFVL